MDEKELREPEPFFEEAEAFTGEKLCLSVLGELEGFIDQQYPEYSRYREFQSELSFWKERIITCGFGLAATDPLEAKRRELYMQEISRAIEETLSDLELCSASPKTLVALHEDYLSSEPYSLSAHRTAFAIAYLIHTWKESNNDSSSASEVLSKAYEVVYPSEDEIIKMIKTKVVASSIPDYVVSALQPFIEAKYIIQDHSYFIAMKAPCSWDWDSINWQPEKGFSYAFLSEWIKHSDGSPYRPVTFKNSRNGAYC